MIPLIRNDSNYHYYIDYHQSWYQDFYSFRFEIDFSQLCQNLLNHHRSIGQIRLIT